MLEETTPTIDLHQNLHRLIGPVSALLTNLLIQLSLYGSNPGAYMSKKILETGGELLTVIMPEPGVMLSQGAYEQLATHDITDFQNGNDPGDMLTAQLVQVNGTDRPAIVDIHGVYERCDSGIPDLDTRMGTLPDGTLHTVVSPLHHTCDMLVKDPSVTLILEPKETLHLDVIQVSQDELNQFGISHVAVNELWGGLPEAVGHFVVGTSAQVQVSAALLSVVAGTIGAGLSRIHYELQKRKQGNLSV